MDFEYQGVLTDLYCNSCKEKISYSNGWKHSCFGDADFDNLIRVGNVIFIQNDKKVENGEELLPKVSANKKLVHFNLQKPPTLPLSLKPGDQEKKYVSQPVLKANDNMKVVMSPSILNIEKGKFVNLHFKNASVLSLSPVDKKEKYILQSALDKNNNVKEINNSSIGTIENKKVFPLKTNFNKTDIIDDFSDYTKGMENFYFEGGKSTLAAGNNFQKVSENIEVVNSMFTDLPINPGYKKQGNNIDVNSSRTDEESEENLIALLELVRQNECIWNFTLPLEKRNKVLIGDAWYNIANKFNGWTPRIAKDKYTSLKETFMRRISKPQSGSAAKVNLFSKLII